jgi:hypothetical protein
MSRKQRQVLLPILIGTALVSGALVIAFGRTTKPKTSELIETASAPSAPVREPIQNIRFTVYDVGIYPAQLHIRKGMIGISIEDRTGNSAGLLIERENGNGRVPVGQVRRLVDQLRGRERFRLEPGRYRVSDANRQTGEAELIVEPQ